MSHILVRVLRELLGCEEPGHVAGGSHCPPGVTDPVIRQSSSHHGSSESGGECAELSPVLLLGPPGSGKSGLLFRSAVLAAEEGAGQVIFLSRDPLQRLPRGGSKARDPLILKRIRFLYPSSLGELLHLVASLHLTSPATSLILLDGLERYLNHACSPADGALISGLLLDSAAYLKCAVLVSAVPPSDGINGAFLAVERYFPTQCKLYTEETAEQEEGMYNISFPPLFPQCSLHIAELVHCHPTPEIPCDSTDRI